MLSTTDSQATIWFVVEASDGLSQQSRSIWMVFGPPLVAMPLCCGAYGLQVQTDRPLSVQLGHRLELDRANFFCIQAALASMMTTKRISHKGPLNAAKDTMMPGSGRSIQNVAMVQQ